MASQCIIHYMILLSSTPHPSPPRKTKQKQKTQHQTPVNHWAGEYTNTTSLLCLTRHLYTNTVKVITVKSNQSYTISHSLRIACFMYQQNIYYQTFYSILFQIYAFPVDPTKISLPFYKFEIFNYLNVAFISYKLTMWD